MDLSTMLPIEILDKVFLYLAPKHRKAVVQVSHRWGDVCDTVSQRLNPP